MMNHYIYLLFVLLLIAGSCKESTKPAVDTSVKENSAATQKILPPISKEEIIQLYETADYLDYIFFDFQFSMNQSDPNAVKAAVTFISNEGPKEVPASCKAIGHLVFQQKGEIIKEADLFFTENCYFYAFTNDENRQTHFNAMTDQGIGFYQRMFTQAMNPAPAK